MSRPHELSGLEVDPHCVHCALAEPLQQFLDAHPEKNDVQILGELLQIVADFAACRVPPGDPQSMVIATAPQLLVVLLRKAFAGAVVLRKSRN